MELYLVCCLSALNGITPCFFKIDKQSMYADTLRHIVINFYQDEGLVYAEVYRVCGDMSLVIRGFYVFDGNDLFESDFFIPSSRSLKNFIKKYSVQLLKL